MEGRGADVLPTINGGQWHGTGADGVAHPYGRTGRGTVAPTKTPKNRDGAKGKAPPPLCFNLTSGSGSASSDRYSTQTLRLFKI
jgi:hypothetical protein